MEEAMRDLFWLSDEAWAALEPHLPHNQPGKPRVDDRRVISGILHILKTGGRWRDVPPDYGPAKTIYNRYTRWARRGVWQRIFAKIAAAGPIPAGACTRQLHDADRLRDWLQARGIEAVIPGRAARVVVFPLNRVAYRRRNVIERRMAQELEAHRDP